MLHTPGITASDHATSADPLAGAVYRTPFAGLRVRLLAAVLDLAVVLLAAIAVDAATGMSPMGRGSLVLVAVVMAVYLAAGWGFGGASAGQRIVGLRVVRAADGGPVSPLMALVRVAGIALAAAPLLLGFIWVARDSRNQGWHDKVAGTVVIHDR